MLPAARSIPPGVSRAPLNFGSFSTRILIGNFGDGRISGYTSGGDFRGQLRDMTGRPVQIGGLWSLHFGIETAASPNKLYFTAGPHDEADGLFGSLAAVPANH